MLYAACDAGKFADVHTFHGRALRTHVFVEWRVCIFAGSITDKDHFYKYPSIVALFYDEFIIDVWMFGANAASGGGTAKYANFPIRLQAIKQSTIVATATHGCGLRDCLRPRYRGIHLMRNSNSEIYGRHIVGERLNATRLLVNMCVDAAQMRCTRPLNNAFRQSSWQAKKRFNSCNFTIMHARHRRI